ncbi:Adhesion G-protein coupled receptor G7 [Labeo rohita]|uniref:Adhesion G-protein coupled receptor G7 n=1 Tax=Labeo rohita TaxID=84645 RepID=A0ABQ8LHY6_LABRO|nr:Adhesion G-protein coupled receptor G7 [Labeo rohita]
MMMDRSMLLLLLLIFLSAFINEGLLQLTPGHYNIITNSPTTTTPIITTTNSPTTTTPITTTTSTPTTTNSPTTTTPITTTTNSPTTTTPITTTTTPITTTTSSPTTTTPITTTTNSATTTTPTTTTLSDSTTWSPTTTTSTTSSTSATSPNPLLTTSQPTGNTCPEETVDDLTFPLTVIGQISYSIQLCPPGTPSAGNPMALAECLSSTHFHGFGGLQFLDCGLNLEAFESKVNGTLEENIYVASSVQMLTSKPEQLTSQNITSAATIINNLLSATMLNESVAESVVATISQLMYTDEDQYSEDTYDALESLTKTLEDFALKMSNINSSVLVQPNLVVQSIKLSNWTPQVQFYTVAGLSQNSPESVGQTLGADTANTASSSGRPTDLLLTIKMQNDSQKDWGNKNLSIGMVLYENDRFFNSKIFNSELDTKRRVVAASLTDKSFLDNVEFAIWPKNTSGSTSYDFACVYWDYAQRDWRTEGCVKILDPDGPRCECNHTTNFAVLVNSKASVSEHNVIPSSDLQQTVDQGPCTAITALLQYFLLSTFAWNILYAAHKRPQRSATSFPHHRHDSRLGCWLASLDKTGRFDPKRPMLWGFLLPLAVMLCFNTSLLVYFSQTICCGNPNLKSSRTTPMKKKILSSFSLAVVLGLSWVVGYFVLITHDKTLYIILSVVFCLCNTTQVR